jgi:hypothetical protein
MIQTSAAGGNLFGDPDRIFDFSLNRILFSIETQCAPIVLDRVWGTSSLFGPVHGSSIELLVDELKRELECSNRSTENEIHPHICKVHSVPGRMGRLGV